MERLRLERGAQLSPHRFVPQRPCDAGESLQVRGGGVRAQEREDEFDRPAIGRPEGDRLREAHE